MAETISNRAIRCGSLTTDGQRHHDRYDAIPAGQQRDARQRAVVYARQLERFRLPARHSRPQRVPSKQFWLPAQQHHRMRHHQHDWTRDYTHAAVSNHAVTTQGMQVYNYGYHPFWLHQAMPPRDLGWDFRKSWCAP
jgi:hypothetical protein